MSVDTASVRCGKERAEHENKALEFELSGSWLRFFGYD